MTKRALYTSRTAAQYLLGNRPDTARVLLQLLRECLGHAVHRLPEMNGKDRLVLFGKVQNFEVQGEAPSGFRIQERSAEVHQHLVLNRRLSPDRREAARHLRERLLKIAEAVSTQNSKN